MILTEQIYKKLNRPYYHGQKSQNNDSSISLFKGYYLTTDAYYAYQFTQNEGCIKIHYLKKDVNICNLKSKKDFQKIEDYFRKEMGPEVCNQLTQSLKEKDWLDCMDVSFRNNFIDVLQVLGYDGFFNIECEDPIGGKLMRIEGYPGYPSIYIFDTNLITTSKILYGLQQFETLPDIKKHKQQEIDFIEKQLYNIHQKYNQLKTTSIEFENMVEDINSFNRLITYEEFKCIFQNFNIEKYRAKLNEKKKIKKQHIQDWWQKKISNTEFENFVKPLILRRL